MSENVSKSGDSSRGLSFWLSLLDKDSIAQHRARHLTKSARITTTPYLQLPIRGGSGTNWLLQGFCIQHRMYIGRYRQGIIDDLHLGPGNSFNHRTQRQKMRAPQDDHINIVC